MFQMNTKIKQIKEYTKMQVQQVQFLSTSNSFDI